LWRDNLSFFFFLKRQVDENKLKESVIMNFKEIKELIEILDKSTLTEINIEDTLLLTPSVCFHLPVYFT
jgi:hypothetical protein